MSFIDDIREATKRVETPWPFIQWACYAAVAAIVKNNVYLNKEGIYNLYANMYVMLIGRSGMRKGFAIWLASELAAAAKTTRVLSGQNSIQGVLDELRNTYTTENGGPPVAGGESFLISEEFSTFLIEDPNAYSLLTTLYDTHAHEKRPWTKKLRDIRYEIKRPCLTLLGASNLRLFEEVIPKSAYEGGFIARLMVIYEDKRRVKNPLTGPAEGLINIEKYSDELKRIASKRGAFTWSSHGKALYDSWYMGFDSEGKDDPTGFVERIHEHILKVAMLISLINRGDMLLEETDIKEAMDLCFAGTTNIRKLTQGKGKSALGQQTKLVLMALISNPNHRMSRKELLRKYYGEFSSIELDSIIQTLTQAGGITTQPIGPETYYILKDEIAEYYKSMENKEGN